MKTLAFLIAACVAGQGASARRVGVDVPAAMRGESLETSVVCRDAGGRWDGVGEWRAAEDEIPLVVVKKGCRTLLRRAGAAVYLASPMTRDLDGIQSLSLQHQWLRTVEGPSASSQPYWVGDGTSAAECLRTSEASVCLFVHAEESGALVTLDGARIQFALSRAASPGRVAAWQAAPWGRLVRIRAPGHGPWRARVSVLERALRHGRDLLQQPRSSAAAVVHGLGDESFWLEGADPEPGARLEISGRAAATSRIDLSLVRGSPLTVYDAQLAPEEVIEGEVRSEGRLVAGALVTLTRFLESAPGEPENHDERPMERIGEMTTDATGRFRFDGLAPDEYELAVSHSRRGRARLVVKAPSIHRISVKPRAVLRGRVVAAGVPVAGAAVTVLPSYDAILDARNPATLMADSVRTAADGRFEVVAPDEGQLTLTALRGQSAARIALGAARDLPAVLDIGDVRLDDPFVVVILLALPASCVLSAAGPLGHPGILLQRAEPVAPGRWVLRTALEGRWLVEASCGGMEVALDPAVIDIQRRSRELFRLTLRRVPVQLR